MSESDPRTRSCDLCGRDVDELELTSDSHPHGPNLMVCGSCIELDERLPPYEADVIEDGWEADR